MAYRNMFDLLNMFKLIFFTILLHFCTGAPVLEKDGDEQLNLLQEQSGYFEGDMLLTLEQEQAIMEAKESRNGLRNVDKRWPNNTVVFYINETDFDENNIRMIENGMADIANKTCLKFQPKTSDEQHFVTIQGSQSGCFSNVGYQPDGNEEKQVLNLSKGCFKHGTIVHEMLHTLGFYHMQSTYDRDEFVKIVWENITPGHEHNFYKYSNNTINDFGVKYDYGSVMHYSDKAFSKNGEETIIPLQQNVTVGQRQRLSERDVLKIDKMYCQAKIV